MKKVGITGQAGFVGNHLYTTLTLDESVELVPFERAYFNGSQKQGDMGRSFLLNIIVRLLLT